MKRIDIRPVLRDELDGQGEGARGIDVVVAKYLIVDRASLEHMRLQGYLDGNGRFGLHGQIPRIDSVTQ